MYLAALQSLQCHCLADRTVDAYKPYTWMKGKGHLFEFEVKVKPRICKQHQLCSWDKLTAYRNIDYLCVGDLAYVKSREKGDSLALIVALHQDHRGQDSPRWTFVLFVWMISQKQLEVQKLDYRLQTGKSYILSNWGQVLPIDYFERVPACSILYMDKIEWNLVFDVSKKGQDGLFQIRDFHVQSGCKLSEAIHRVSIYLEP